MEKPPFLLQPNQLQKGIFSAYSARMGVQTILNINYLPDLLQYVKTQLLPEQLLRLQDYYLQNYLMQLSISYNGQPHFEELVSTILVHIRSSNNFWYRHNNKEIIEQQQEMKHYAISSYQTDIAQLRQAFQQEQQMLQFTPKYPKKTNTHFTYRLLHINTEPVIVTKHSLNHLAYIPHFLIHKAKRQITHSLQNQEQKGQKFKGELDEEKMKTLIKECVLFMLKNKSVKVVSKQQVASGNLSEQIQQNEANEAEDEIEDLSENISISENEKQAEHSKTLIDDFIEYLEVFPNISKFYSSHYMYNLTQNLLLACQKLLSSLSASKLPQKQAQASFKSHQLKDSVDMIHVPEICRLALSNLSERQINQDECQVIIDCFLQQWETKLKYFEKDIKQKLDFVKKGWLCSQRQINDVKQGYEEMLSRPQFVQLNKFRAMGAGVPWKQQDYKKFLKGLAQYINIPTNNKRIATYMGDQIEPNHVKHVKGVYLTVMKDRMERGECGGGKRGKCLSKSEFIDKDIESFSMRWFEKSKKIKKKLKRKRRNSSQEEIEEDADSQY